MNKFLSVVGLAVVGLVTSASAAITVAPIDTTDFMTIAAAVITALGVFYGVKKAMGLLN